MLPSLYLIEHLATRTDDKGRPVIERDWAGPCVTREETVNAIEMGLPANVVRVVHATPSGMVDVTSEIARALQKQIESGIFKMTFVAPDLRHFLEQHTRVAA